MKGMRFFEGKACIGLNIDAGLFWLFHVVGNINCLETLFVILIFQCLNSMICRKLNVHISTFTMLLEE